MSTGIPSDSVLRLLCDAKLEFHIDGPDGTTIGIGRVDRSIPRWLRRRIRKRDGGSCRFPGCDRQIRQIHHVAHRVRDRGPTDAGNLASSQLHTILDQGTRCAVVTTTQDGGTSRREATVGAPNLP